MKKMEEKNKNNRLLYIIIAILTIGVIGMGILLMVNIKKEKKLVTENGVTWQGEEVPEGVEKIPEITMKDDGHSIAVPKK